MQGEVMARSILSSGESSGREVGSGRHSGNVQVGLKPNSVFERGNTRRERQTGFAKGCGHREWLTFEEEEAHNSAHFYVFCTMSEKGDCGILLLA